MPSGISIINMPVPVIDIIINKSPHLSWLKQRTIYLVRHGSHAYNTNVEGSDEDFKGVAIPPKQYFFGFQNKFAQAELKTPDPDTTIFELRKFFSLAVVCNPNIIETLYVDPVDHCFVSPLGAILLDKRDLFLSKQIKQTMSGYAYDQLQRIKRHKQWIIDPPKRPPTRQDFGLLEEPLISTSQYEAAQADINKELEQYNFDFLHNCPEPIKIAVKNAWRDMLVKLKVTTEDQWLTAARTIGLSDNFIAIMQKERQYRNALTAWNKFLNWQKTRNPKRYAMEEKYGYDTKNGYHLARLLIMAEEIPKLGKVIVKRTKDRDFLLDIRNGRMPFDELVNFAEQIKQKLDSLYIETTLLPDFPDYNKLEKLCISLIERTL